MRVLVPVTFDTTTMLTSTTASDTYSAWASTSTYALEDRVTHEGRYWENTVGIIDGTDFEPGVDGWIDVGAANKVAMFDNSPTSLTTGTGTLTVVVAPGDIDSAAFFNVTGSSLSLSGVVGTSTYSNTADVSGQSEAVFTDLPGGTGLSLTMTLTGSGNVSIGASVFGSVGNLGTAQAGAEAGITDYSTKQTDTYGETIFVRRGFAKTLSIETLIPSSDMNAVISMLYRIRATPTVWIASTKDEFSAAGVVYGYYRDFSIDIRYPTYSICSLEIEGLV